MNPARGSILNPIVFETGAWAEPNLVTIIFCSTVPSITSRCSSIKISETDLKGERIRSERSRGSNVSIITLL